MEITRKIIAVGNSKAITLPDEWLKPLEQIYGELDSVFIQVSKSRLNIRVTKTRGLEEWTKFVLKRANYHCQICGKNSKEARCDIIAHHIKNKIEFPELALEFDNGMAVCRTCHGKIHRAKHLTKIIPEV